MQSLPEYWWQSPLVELFTHIFVRKLQLHGRYTYLNRGVCPAFVPLTFFMSKTCKTGWSLFDAPSPAETIFWIALTETWAILDIYFALSPFRINVWEALASSIQAKEREAREGKAKKAIFFKFWKSSTHTVAYGIRMRRWLPRSDNHIYIYIDWYPYA